MIHVSALILTYNEAPNIGRVLDSLGWVENALIIDSFSTDETRAIAQRYPKVRILQRHFDSFAGQCNFGLKQISTPWVLSIDADYILTAEIISEIASLQPSADVAGYRASFVYCIYGRSLRSTLYPPRTVLYRPDLARYEDEGHGHRVRVRGRVDSLAGKIYHDDRKSLSRWIEAQDRYAKIEARHLLAIPEQKLNAQDRLRRKVYFAPVVMFFYLLFGRGLIFDGWPGWFYVFQRTLAETLLSLRLIMERVGWTGQNQGDRSDH